jgi:hypothetical protein
MGGANGSRECALDDKLSDTHQLQCREAMGFAKGSTHTTNYEPPYSRTGIQISNPPLPVSGSNFSSYRSKLGASAAFMPDDGSQ